MSLNRRFPGLVNAPTDASAQQSQWMEQVTTTLRSGLGQSKSNEGKWLTWQDLEQAEVVVKSAQGDGSYQPAVPPDEPLDMSPPPGLTDVEASGGMTAIYITWADPALAYYYHIEIHRAQKDDVGMAVMVGTTMGNIFQDVLGSDDTTKYYWVRIVKQSGGENIIGPWHATKGVSAAAATDPDWVLKDLEGRINESHLNDLLSSEIGKIPRIAENTAAIIAESEARVTEDEALASQITTLAADMDGGFAGVRDEMQVIVSDQQKLASRVSTVELDLEDTRGAIEQQFQVFEDEFEQIRAEYTVKLDVDGYVGGFGLVNDGDVITALWRVDVFGVGSPGSEELTFAVDAEENRVVMDGAFIKNASITDAQIGNMTVDKLTGGTADWVEANIRDASITNAKIGNVIRSDDYEAGTAGWIINKIGVIECFDLYARGTIEGSIIRGSVVEGGLIIDSGVSITKPTEADKGVGTIRFLCLADYSYHYEKEEDVTEVEFFIPSAGYMGEGYDMWGDGNTEEPVYNNFERNIKHTISPKISFNGAIDFYWNSSCPSPGASTEDDFDFTLKIYGVNPNNHETLLKTINARIEPSPFDSVIPEGVIEYSYNSSTIRCYTSAGIPYDTVIGAYTSFIVNLDINIDYEGDYKNIKFVSNRLGTFTIIDSNRNYI